MENSEIRLILMRLHPFITNLEGALFISETLKDATVITKTADHFLKLLR